jgi:hypothetical protein
MRSLVERFWARVNKAGTMPSAEAVAAYPEIRGECCWIYGKGSSRYGTFRVSAERVAEAHRMAWYLETGKWPEPQCLHKCDRGRCVRFSHLFEGTVQDNVDDMLKKKRDRLVGERHHHTNLTDEDIREMRRLGAPWVRHPFKRGTILLKRRLAKRFGISEKQVWKILKHQAHD